MGDWNEVILKDVVSKLGDGLHGTPLYDDEGEYYFINGNNLSNGKIKIKDETKRITVEEYEKYKKDLNDRTILVSINGTLGNVALYNNEPCVLGKSACYFNVKDGVNKLFVRYVVSTPRFNDYINNYANGTTIKNVSLKTMREYPFRLPDIAEQKAIASVLSSLDDKIDLLHRQNKTLDAMAETLFRQWFIEEVDDSWEVNNFGILFNLIMGQSPKGDTYNENGIGLPLLNGAADYDNGYNARKYTTDPKRINDVGDIIFCIRGTIGNIEFVNKKFCLGRGVAAIRPKLSQNKHFIFLQLKRIINELISNASGSVIVGLTKDDINLHTFSMPPEKLLINFSDIVTPLFKKIDNNTKEIRTLQNLRDTLLPKLMSGEVRVKH